MEQQDTAKTCSSGEAGSSREKMSMWLGVGVVIQEQD